DVLTLKQQLIQISLTDYLGFLRAFCDGDEAQVKRFMQKFEEQWPIEIARLEEAIRHSDWEAVRRVAHAFRPQLEFVGLKGAAATLLRLEQAATDSQPMHSLTAQFAQVKACLAELNR
ncbi:MAG TPA: Hpt domain-containing protein, partial [Saprospiraceae bacterium]|nr:Hpt domain-containing protein [Saprospiraceae bacterium]